MSRTALPVAETSAAPEPPAPRPLGLVAELTYRCPLHCPYCSNPVTYPVGRNELSTEDWARVLHEAANLGVVHALFSGGEPLLRDDLPEIIAAARSAGLYTNLITSGIGLTPKKASSLRQGGLDSIQISFQSDQPELADLIAGTTAHAHKLQAAKLVTSMGFPLTVNVVLHRANIDRLEKIILLAEELNARRLELANTQFYGWAHSNRHALLPTREQVNRAEQIALAAKERLKGTMEILYVMPDYLGDRPKPCMNGWGRRFITVNPIGDVLPCPTAFEIGSLRFDNVHEHDVGWIWRKSEAFNRFRGTGWMPEPCKSCDQREIDFGGCRCQAALLTGDPSNTDPACSLSPHRAAITRLLDSSPDSSASSAPLYQVSFRTNPK